MPPLTIPKRFKKILSKKDPGMQAAVLECVQRLAEDPRHPGLNTHRMQGSPGVWEAYVDAGNRVTFHYEKDGSIALRMNCNHDMLRRSP